MSDPKASPAQPQLKSITADELCDAIAQAPLGRRPLFVLAGYGHSLRTYFSLAEPRDFRAMLRITADGRLYDTERVEFRLFPQADAVTVELDQALLYRLVTPLTDRFPVFVVCSIAPYAAAFTAQLTSLAFEAATVARDWRLQNALEWIITESRAREGELLPRTGIQLPEKLAWRLRKPVFRDASDAVLYQWELRSQLDGPQERPLVSCVTDHEGAVAREADLLPLRLMFSRPAAAEPKKSAGAEAAHAPDAQQIISEFEKRPPKRRSPRSAAGRLEEDEAQMQKIRRLFEL